ncbi:hypothetical protein H072_1114 [Dactylellina haptotyla CBS 200.50]|uniref:Uncharacterized protein n=1 Tax=Dactylellina haptotyla (strain CBS 200.50) TaxID=1284197 RepID=S8APX4_DACHA|nr:hypothetical protein H072_1114 [Dactylellina haptotyla CBS 200.50]
MGCAPSKQDIGRKLKGSRKQELEISSPTDFHHNSLSYPSTLCVNCDMPSRTLLASLGNKDTSLCCSCDGGDQILDLKMDFKPLSPIASDATLTTPSKRDLPTAYNFPFGFSHTNKGYGEDCACPFDTYYGEDDDHDHDSECAHKRYASFSSSTWKVEEKVAITAQEVVSCSRSNSYASSDCLRSRYDGMSSDIEPFIDDAACTLRHESIGSKLRNRRRLPFEAFNQSSPDLLSASARKSQRVSKDQVKVIRIRGSRSTNWI